MHLVSSCSAAAAVPHARSRNSTTSSPTLRLPRHLCPHLPHAGLLLRAAAQDLVVRPRLRHRQRQRRLVLGALLEQHVSAAATLLSKVLHEFSILAVWAAGCVGTV